MNGWFSKVGRMTLALVMLISLTLGGFLNDLNVSAQGFEPGTYEGAAEGFHGDIKVEVTVTADDIVSIEVDQDETAGVGDQAIEQLVEQVIATQSLNLDVVAGATYSSEGFMAAIMAALELAGADIEALQTKEVEIEAEDTNVSSQTTDVIVIGGGGAGLAAAVSAHQKRSQCYFVRKNATSWR